MEPFHDDLSLRTLSQELSMLIQIIFLACKTPTVAALGGLEVPAREVTPVQFGR